MPIEKKCAVCEKTMLVRPCLIERKKYCSKKCANIGLRGKRRSRATEFQKGQVSPNKMPIGSVTIRTRKRDGKQRRWIKIGTPDKWILHCRYIWERAYGPMPSGLLIHHIDRNTLNDGLSNLALITRGSHLLEHRPEFEDKRLEGLRHQNGK